MDERALWVALASPKVIDAPFNVAQRLSTIRRRLLSESFYLGNPDLHLPTHCGWMPYDSGRIFADAGSSSPHPIVFAIVVSVASDAFAFSVAPPETSPAGQRVLSAYAARPLHANFHADHKIAIDHLHALTSNSMQQGDSLPFEHILFQPLSNEITHSTYSWPSPPGHMGTYRDVPAYDMHDRLLRPSELRRNLLGADVVLRFHLFMGDEVVAHVVNITVLVPPKTTWPVTPRRSGSVATNPYPVRSFDVS
ncbi:hypothetical protein H0H93_003966 [Arthromyces matolae]|nr:hypothetical protein H0H93_003966 [Arthromyces matolae]